MKFQSTHPRGVRHRDLRWHRSHGVVSIHAPARGATYGFIAGVQEKESFNPRTREGCDKSI